MQEFTNNLYARFRRNLNLGCLDQAPTNTPYPRLGILGKRVSKSFEATMAKCVMGGEKKSTTY